MTKRTNKRTSSGKIRGRPVRGRDEFDSAEMEREFEGQMRKLERRTLSSNDDTPNIIRAERSKRGGSTRKQRALELMKQDAERRGTKPDLRNLDAVQRWLKDPTASRLEAALQPRPVRTKRKPK